MSYRNLTKLGALLFALCLLASCAVAPLYPSTTSPYRAQVFFTSPHYQDIFLSIDRLALLVFSANDKCEMISQGRVRLVNEVPSSKSAYVAANERLYLKIWAYNSDAISQVRKRRSAFFSFVPQNNKAYEVRHIDNPKDIRVEVYELGAEDSGGESVEVELQPWSSCDEQ